MCFLMKFANSVVVIFLSLVIYTTIGANSLVSTRNSKFLFSSSSNLQKLQNSLIARQSVSYMQDNLRKELIKAQILQRLGLSEKPVVDLSHKISKDLVLETIRRTEGEFWNNYGPSIVGTNPQSNTETNGTISQLKPHSSRSEDDGNFAKASQIISFPGKGPVLNNQTLLSFSFAGNHAFGVGIRVRKAHIWIKFKYESVLGPEFAKVLYPKGITFYIFHVHGNFTNDPLRPPSLSTQDVTMDLVASRSVGLDSLGWQKLDVTSIVHKWYNKLSRHRIRHGGSFGNTKLTLLVDCNGCGASVKPILFSSTMSGLPQSYLRSSSSRQPQPYEYQPLTDLRSSTDIKNDETRTRRIHLEEDEGREMPFLVIETESGSNNRRTRRRALECSPRVKQCCKQRFFISFQDLGWEDWIIAPRGYYANYCRGHCGGTLRTPDTFLNYHTHVMEEFRRTPAGQMEFNGLQPCCAPTKFSSMSIMYFGPDLNIIKRDLPKMIIEECGCP